MMSLGDLVCLSYDSYDERRNSQVISKELGATASKTLALDVSSVMFGKLVAYSTNAVHDENNMFLDYYPNVINTTSNANAAINCLACNK